MEKLFEIYYGFGKGEGFELYNSEVMDDTKENRKELIEEHFSYWDTFEDEKKFINGDEDRINFERDGVDWDEATVAYILAVSYEDKLKKIEDRRNEEIKRLNELFGK